MDLTTALLLPPSNELDLAIDEIIGMRHGEGVVSWLPSRPWSSSLQVRINETFIDCLFTPMRAEGWRLEFRLAAHRCMGPNGEETLGESPVLAKCRAVLVYWYGKRNPPKPVEVKEKLPDVDLTTSSQKVETVPAVKIKGKRQL